MKIVLGNDHGGLELKNAIIDYLSEKGINYINVGTDTGDSVDYPVYAKNACSHIQSGECNFGVLCCTTGIGMSMVANKQKGIRAALISDEFSAVMTRKHNDANVICFGNKIITKEQALHYLELFISTDFEGGRHTKRVEMFE